MGLPPKSLKETGFGPKNGADPAIENAFISMQGAISCDLSIWLPEYFDPGRAGMIMKDIGDEFGLAEP